MTTLTTYTYEQIQAIGSELREVTTKYLSIEHNAKMRSLVYPMLEESYRQWIRMMTSLEESTYSAAWDAAWDAASYAADSAADRAADSAADRAADSAADRAVRYNAAWLNFWIDLPLDQWLAYAREDWYVSVQ